MPGGDSSHDSDVSFFTSLDDVGSKGDVGRSRGYGAGCTRGLNSGGNVGSDVGDGNVELNIKDGVGEGNCVGFGVAASCWPIWIGSGVEGGSAW